MRKRTLTHTAFTPASALAPSLRQNISNNLMEVLVAEEVDRQFRLIPHKVRTYVKKADIVAYALNRLPALYATTQRGRQIQQKEGYIRFQAQIEQAVLHGIAAVQRDPLRTAADTWRDPNMAIAEVALNDLRRFLQDDRLTWDNLAASVKYHIAQTSQP